MRKYPFLFLLIIVFASCKKQEILFAPVANEQFELSLLLKLDDKNCAFDEQRKLLKYSIDEANLKNYAPYVQFQKISEISFGTTLLTNNSINDLGNLELNKLYEIWINTNGEINKFNLMFTNIPIIQIVTHDEILNEPKILSKMTVNYPNKDRLSDVNWTGIELRGATSLKFDKKSYGIGIYGDRSLKNQKYASFFDLETNNKWILNSVFVDESKLRNKVSFDIWKSMPGNAEHVTMESRYVEVFINHSAKGLYCLTENFTSKKLNMNSESVCIEGTDNSAITHFKEYPSKNPKSAYWEGWEQKNLISNQAIKWTDFENLSQLIVNGSDEDFKNNIGQRIDLDNVIDYFLLLNLCYGTDNLGKNWFFLKRNQGTKFTIVPWDLDGTWGRSPVSEPQVYDRIVSNAFFDRLIKVNPDNHNQRMKMRWLELRATVFSESNILNLLNSNFEELEAYHIIPLENQLWQTNLNLDNERLYMKSWISNHLSFVDNYFQ